MRRLILIGLLAVMTLPAEAAKRVTVGQLEQAVAAATAAHHPDADVAHQLGSFQLSERLTDAALDHFAHKLTLGPRTALALQLLADQSAFLAPPPSELPATEPPDPATQKRLMDAARGYVIDTVPHLPNFFATRTTSRFDDGPHVLQQGDWPVRDGLQLAGSTSRQISFRDGKEIQDPVVDVAATSTASQQANPELGLHSFGEFGPELSVVLTDTAKGNVTWSHWEQTPTGLAAVFHYSVPRAASHYAVQYCCLRDEQFIERRQLTFNSRSQSGQQMANLPKTEAATPFNDAPGYHGDLFIDPASGAILRITLEAELKESDPITRAATVVQYGPVKIGDQSYICPVRSIAFSMEQPPPSKDGKPRDLPILLVNETSFTHYHRLVATSRILAESPNSSVPDSTASSAVPQNPGTPSPASPSSSTAAPDAGTQLAANAVPPAPGSVSHEDPAPVIAASPPPAPAIPEVTMGPSSGVPDLPASTSPSQDQNVTFKVTSRLVDVGVVVYDKKGHPVRDLKPEDFELYDNGHKEDIRAFSQYADAPQPLHPAPTIQPPATPPAAPAEQSYSNRAADPASVANPAPEASTTVLLIDESHIAWNDMNNARQQVLKFLAGVAPGERVGLYTMTPLGFRVLQEVTTDHAALIARLQKWMPVAQSVSQAQDEEMRNRQQINEVHNVTDLNSVNGNQIDVPDAQTTTDPQLRTMGSNPARASLIILSMVARHLSAVPGHKNLVWISSDNVFADWQNQAVGIDKSPKFIDTFAMHAQEAMNDAHVAVFPFDVSQLETSAISADIQHRNVELDQAASDTASLNGGSVARNSTAGRITAEMQQDIRPIQGPVRQVADATGGRIIRRAGDLAAQLNSIVEDGHATYQLSFSPQGPADDQYHTITVKLAGKQHGLTPRYRTGYVFAKDAATLKDRFQQAVWRPMDVSEIAVTAVIDPMNSGANVKVNIATADLGLEQQAGRWMDKLDIFFIQRDDAGIHAQVDGQTIGLRLKSSTYQGLLPTGVPFQHFVQLKSGMASLRVVVVDENSGRMGSVTVPAPALTASK